MMKALIIEDEFRNYNRLRRMLTAFDPTMIIEGPLESVVETRQWLAAHRGDAAPDIVFADIRLNDGVSFDALDALDSASTLVFTTAYDEYALRAFQYNGVAYLLKPIDEEELHQTLRRIIAMQNTTATALQADVQGIKEALAQLQTNGLPHRERFLIPYKDGFEVVDVNEVDLICSENKDTRAYLRSGKRYSLPLSLDELERQLSPKRFFRVNRQCIVNIACVASLKTYFGGKLRVVLRGYDDLNVMCSRERAPMVKEWLNR